jgi:hypothetical protein
MKDYGALYPEYQKYMTGWRPANEEDTGPKSIDEWASLDAMTSDYLKKYREQQAAEKALRKRRIAPGVVG